MEERKHKVVVIGGGTGTFTVLKGLKQFYEIIEVTAIISMADSGGSTGRLRDEFGQLPVGDVRMALAALSRDITNHEELLRELFLYRFEKGSGLSGHNFGNLLLTALTDILSSEAEAVKVAGKILRVRGRVIPVTNDDVHLQATYDDGVVVIGEHAIDDPDQDRSGHRITELTSEPAGAISAEAKQAIEDADLIVLGPGDLYSSLLANCVITGVPEALAKAPGQLVYVTNLMERHGQTEGLSASDCYNELCRYIGRCPDVVLMNSGPLPAAAVEHYANSDGVHPVVDDSDGLGTKVVRANLVAADTPKRQNGDAVTRSLIRHDSEALASALIQLLQ